MNSMDRGAVCRWSWMDKYGVALGLFVGAGMGLGLCEDDTWRFSLRLPRLDESTRTLSFGLRDHSTKVRPRKKCFSKRTCTYITSFFFFFLTQQYNPQAGCLLRDFAQAIFSPRDLSICSQKFSFQSVRVFREGCLAL